MTSHFDDLAELQLLYDKNKEYEELVLYIADLSESEIERKLGIGYDNREDKQWIAKIYGKWGIFRWLDYIHGKYDHTEKWHLNLISLELTRLVYVAYRLLSENEVSKLQIEETMKRYPKVYNLLINLRIKETAITFMLDKKGE